MRRDILRTLSFPFRALVALALMLAMAPAGNVSADHGEEGLDPVRNQPIPCELVGTPRPPRGAKNIVHVANFCGIAGTDVEFSSRTDSTGKVRDYAFVGTIGGGLRIFDVTDPLHPVRAGGYNVPGYQGDIQVRGNIATISYDGVSGEDSTGSVCLKTQYPGANGQGIDIVHLEYNPATARYVTSSVTCVANPPGGAHTNTIHPTSRFIAISNPGDYAVDIIDIRGITLNKRARHMLRIIDQTRFNSTRCPTGAGFKCVIAKNPNGTLPKNADGAPRNLFRPHDVSFSRDGNIMYVAALNSTFIMDVSRLNRPLSTVELVVPTLSIIENREDKNYTRPETSNDIFLSHQSDVTPDGKMLVVSDEKGGGVQNTECNENPGDKKLIGALHFYALADLRPTVADKTDKASHRNPVKLGIYVNPQPTLGIDPLNPIINGLPRLDRGCTVHVFRIGGNGTSGPGPIEARYDGVSKLNGRQLVTGWYGAGVWRIDFSRPPTSAERAGGKEDPQTTWGRTLAYNAQPGADVWSAKEYKGYVYAGDLLRGFDVYRFATCPGALCVPTPTATR